MTRLSSLVLCSKWLPPPKTFLGVFPKQCFTLASQSPAVFWANGCCFRKGSVEGSANYSLHLSPKWLLLYKTSLRGSANCALHLSPSLLLGSKLRELLTCLTHTNPFRRKRPIMLLLLGYSLGLIQSKNKALPPTPYYQSKPPVFCSMKHEPRSKIYYANIMIRRFEPRYSMFRSSQPVRRSPFVLRYSFYFSSFSTSASCNTFRIAGLESCCHSYCSLIESCHWWVLPPIAHVHELIPLILLMHLKYGWTRVTRDPVFGVHLILLKFKRKWWKWWNKALCKSLWSFWKTRWGPNFWNFLPNAARWSR